MKDLSTHTLKNEDTDAQRRTGPTVMRYATKRSPECLCTLSARSPFAVKTSLRVGFHLSICSHLSGYRRHTLLNMTHSCTHFNSQINDTEHIFAALLVPREDLHVPKK